MLVCYRRKILLLQNSGLAFDLCSSYKYNIIWNYVYAIIPEQILIIKEQQSYSRVIKTISNNPS